MRTIFKIAVLSLVLLALIGNFSSAHSETSAKSTLDDFFDPKKRAEKRRQQEIKYAYNRQIRGLIAGAFSLEMWKPFLWDELDAYDYRQSHIDGTAAMSWTFYIQEPFLPYLKRENGFSKTGVISKWQDIPSVGFGFPPDYLRNKKTGEAFKIKDVEYDKFDFFWQAAVEAAPEIEQATGLKINIIKPSDEQSKPAVFGKIRIIPVATDNIDAFTKVERSHYDPSPFHFENVLIGAVPFKSAHPDSFAGFLLTSPENNIEMTVCKVAALQDDAAIKRSIRECLIRSMGLVNSLEAEIEDKKVSRDELKLLGLLYCKDLKSGMDQNEAVGTLVESKSCRE